MKKAIATINTDAGTMTIYYNGSGEYMTAERDDIIETIEDGKPSTIDEACELAHNLYRSAEWDFEQPFDLEGFVETV